MFRSSPLFATMVLGLFLGACSAKDSAQPQPLGTGYEGGVVSEEGGAPDGGMDLEAGSAPDAVVDDAAQGLSVQASISSATLGDEGCDAGVSVPNTGASGGACIAPAGDSGGGRCATPCCGVCRPSSMQIAFSAGPGAAAAHVSISAVELLDANQAVLKTLTASSPQAWDATTSTYVAWDGTVPPSTDLKSSYALTSPTWSTLGQSYGASYHLRITLLIDGSTVVLVSGPLNRLPIVAT